MKFKKLESSSTKPRVVNFKELMDNEGNRGRYLDIPAISQLQDSLIARGWGEPQRLAILATSAQEMGKEGAASKGIGGNGYLGYSSQRMPTSYLDNSADGRARQIHFLLEDLTTKHSNNWLGGGKGGPYLKNGSDAYDKFWNSEDVNEATQIFNKSVIRPAGGLKAWENRAKVAEDMAKHSYQKGGLIYKPFIAEKEDIIRESTYDDSDILSYEPKETEESFEIEPVRIYGIGHKSKQEIIEESTEEPVENIESETMSTRSVTPGTVSYARRNMNVGDMQEWIDLATQEGISFTVYSGVRPNAMTKNGHKSNHSIGMALDIGPKRGQTFADLKRQILSSPRLLAFMREKGIGVINETIPEVMAQTGATGPHFHVGPDTWGKQHFERWLRGEKENLHRLNEKLKWYGQ